MANIFFKTIKLKNFMSYEEAEVNLARDGYVVVKGTNNNPEDSAKSNGSGKSSLFTAICWALTGETISGAKNVSNIYIDGTTEVELSFSYEGREFVVRRTKNPSNLFIYVDGEDKSGKGIRDTSEILTEYIPQITYRLLSSVIILGQGLPQRFTNNTPAGRKEVLEQLSNSDFMIADIKERLSSRKEELNNKITEVKMEQASKSSLIKSIEGDLLILNDSLSTMNSSEIKERINNFETNITNIEEEYNSSAASIDELDKIRIETEDGLNKLELDLTKEKSNLVFEDTEEKQKIIRQLELDKHVIDNDIKDKKSVRDVCPTCGQKLPGVVKIDTTELEERSKKLSELIDSNRQILDEVVTRNARLLNDFERSATERRKEFKDKLSTLTDDLLNSSKHKDELYKKLSDEKANLSIAKSELERFEENVNNIKETIKNKEGEKEQLESDLLLLVSKLESLEKHLDVNSQMNTLVKRDFRGYLLTNVIDFINTRAKVYCNDIFGTTNISFELDGNNILIAYDGKEYEVLSGGEKQKIDVIIQFSIRDMLCKFLDFSSNILVLDEITDALDETGAHKVFDMISKRLDDVKSIYIISHHLLDFDIPEDSEIVIEKGCDKISRIK